MDSTIPVDLLKLKDRLEAWLATRKYMRQPIPDEFRQAAAEMAKRYSPSLVRRTRFAAESRNNRAGVIIGVTAVASASAFASAMASATASALAAQVFCRKGRLD